MKRIYYTTMDKARWPAGEWKTEPDKIQWQDEATGLPCLIKRNTLGALCGYVGVAAGHPMFGMTYDEAPCDVHGGLTFAAFCSEGDEATSICHVPEPGEPDHVWWLGFDCAHSGDATPARHGLPWFAGDVYRNVAYVTAECKSLAAQLKAITE